MDKRSYTPHPFEPTKSELPPEAARHTKTNRRSFLKRTGGGLVVFFAFNDLFSYSNESPAASTTADPVIGVDAWIRIGQDGKITVYTGKVEVGQNIRTSLSQIVAEELMVPVSVVSMIMGDTDLVPYDAGTFGSRTTPQMGTQLHKAAATAREALIAMAAKKWNTGTADLKTENGMVLSKRDNKKISYGELTRGNQLLMPVSEKAKVIAATDWKIAGKTIAKINEQSFITGKHEYVSDMKMPGMLYGKVLRAPSYKAKLLEVNILKIPGVTYVQDGDFIGVAAPDIPTARKAMQAIKAKWHEEAGQPSDKNIFDWLFTHASGPHDDRNAGDTQGNVENGLSHADFKLASTYNIQYIAHVPLEPRAAVAQWEDGKLTVWTGTQRPFGVQQELMDVFNLPKEKVRVLVPDTGSGYGGKHSGEAAIEAAKLAKEAKKPVKLVWTREEEFTWAYFRPGGVIEVNAGVNKDGSIPAWKFINYNSGGAGLETQYKISNRRIAYLPSDTPLKQGSYRGLAATANVFARECHMTDLARLIHMDPLEFRVKNLEDTRFIDVLQAAAKAFNWTGPKSNGHGYGIAGGFEKGGYVGCCAEVMVTNNKEVKVIRIVQAFDCGAIINPHHLENQAMGSIVQGLGGALFEAIEFADGKIHNAALSSYRVPRFTDVPAIEIVLLDRKDKPSAGAGEACIVGVAPAIRNAIVDATGVALNHLPMIPAGRLI